MAGEAAPHGAFPMPPPAGKPTACRGGTTTTLTIALATALAFTQKSVEIIVMFHKHFSLAA